MEDGNQLAEVSAAICRAAWEHSCYFSLENPEKSLLWLYPAIAALFSLPGVASVLVYYNAYGTLYVKPTLILHNSPRLHVLHLPQPLMQSQKIELRGWVMFDGERVARTLLAQAYPPKLSIAFGTLMQASLADRRLALSERRPVPMASILESSGHPFWGAQPDFIRDSVQPLADPSAEFVQRGYGAPFGLSPMEHFHWARVQVQPHRG